MTLVIDGTDPTMVKKILMQSLITSELKGKELLEHIIIMEGCLAIMRGDHPEIVKINLCSLMGLNGQKILDETWKKMGE
jgi:flagellar motor component MotA